MPKPDPNLLDTVRYPFRCEVQTRYTDIDTNQHVNNVAIVELMQEGRIRFHYATGYDRAIVNMTSMVVSFSVDYLGSAEHLTPVEIHVAALAVGRTSHTLAQLMMQNDKLVAYAQAVLVCVRDGQPAENHPAFREAISGWMIKP